MEKEKLKEMVYEVQSLFEFRVKEMAQKIKGMGELFAGMGQSEMMFENDCFLGIGFIFEGFSDDLKRIAEKGVDLCMDLYVDRKSKPGEQKAAKEGGKS